MIKNLLAGQSVDGRVPCRAALTEVKGGHKGRERACAPQPGQLGAFRTDWQEGAEIRSQTATPAGY